MKREIVYNNAMCFKRKIFAHAKSVFEIDINFFKKYNVKTLLMDLDNTLDSYRLYIPTERSKEFIQKLNAQSGSHFRLPTEAEWEYAARAKATDDGKKIPSGSVYKQNSCKSVNECGINPLGIKGMNGNVAEWCQDWFGSYPTEKQTNPTGPAKGTHRVVRGGSYEDFTEWTLRGTTRSHHDPDEASPAIGFRLAMDN